MMMIMDIHEAVPHDAVPAVGGMEHIVEVLAAGCIYSSTSTVP